MGVTVFLMAGGHHTRLGIQYYSINASPMAFLPFYFFFSAYFYIELCVSSLSFGLGSVGGLQLSMPRRLAL